MNDSPGIRKLLVYSHKNVKFESDTASDFKLNMLSESTLCFSLDLVLIRIIVSHAGRISELSVLQVFGAERTQKYQLLGFSQSRFILLIIPND